MANIFADYGGVITGQRYIHRKKTESEVRARLIDNENYGSIGLVGMQRMGKSSLAYNLFESKSDILFDQGIMVIKLVMYNYRSPQAFFEDMATKAFEELEDHSLVNSKIERRYERVFETSIEETSGERVRSFFKCIVSDLKFRVVCIIDEFDYSKTLFANYPQGFFVLRELAYQPENKIGFLFLSRRLMSELESAAGFDVSNFSNIMLNAFLPSYSDEEFEEYFKILSKTSGIEITQEMKNGFEIISDVSQSEEKKNAVANN